MSARSFRRSLSLFSPADADADGTSSISATFATSMTPSLCRQSSRAPRPPNCLAPSQQLEVHLQLLGPVAPLPVLAPSLSAPSRKGYLVRASSTVCRKSVSPSVTRCRQALPLVSRSCKAMRASQTQVFKGYRNDVRRVSTHEVLRRHLSCHVFHAPCQPASR